MDCHSILADGSVVSDSGSYNVAMFAKEFAIPVFVMSPMHKLTPFYAFSQDTFNKFL